MQGRKLSPNILLHGRLDLKAYRRKMDRPSITKEVPLPPRLPPPHGPVSHPLILIACSTLSRCVCCGCPSARPRPCLLYTSDAADDLTRVDLGGRGILEK